MKVTALPGTRGRIHLGHLALVMAVVLFGWMAWQQLTPAAAASATGLPGLGPATAVEYDDVGDPYVLTVPATAGQAGEYVLFWTTDWRSNVPTAVSTDLQHWTRVADVLPVLPSWAVPSRTMTWGPAAQKVTGGWVLYFSTEQASSQLECIGAAFSTSPTGPYIDRSPSPLVCQQSMGGSIDPSVVATGTGGHGEALVWKNDGNSENLPVGIWEQQLTPNGLGVLGAPHRLIGVSAAWEHGIVEGPAMLADTNGGWWLFFSGGAWQSDTYGTGIAWCRTVSGPCRSADRGPLLTSSAGAVSPGGLDTFVDLQGHLWASYSAFPSVPPNARAAMAEDRVLEIAPVLSH